MKTILFSLGSLLFASGLFAQVELQVVEKPMKYGVEYCYELSIDDVEFKSTKKSWMKKMNDFTKEKPKSTENDIEFYDVKIPTISADTLNVYSRIIERSGAVILQSYYQYEGGFISDSNNQIGASEVLKKELTNFGKKEYNNFYFKKIDKESNTHKKLNNELQGLKDDISKNEKLINKRTNGIRENEQTISNLKPEIVSATQEYVEKQEAFSKLSESTDVYKVELKKLKASEKKKDKLENTNKSKTQEIVKFRSQIEDAKQEISTLKAKIETKVIEINDQKALIEQLNQKIIN